MKTLPCALPPLAGETPAGYLGRLASCNLIPLQWLLRHITRAYRVESLPPTDPRYVSAVENLGGLTVGHFDRERDRFRLVWPCHHAAWRPTRCRRCDVSDYPRRACFVCSEGIPTEVISRGGMFCVRHNWWHGEKEDTHVRPSLPYRRAERLLSGVLWRRGVTLHTGEFALACELIRTSHQRTLADPVPGLRFIYPAAVELVFTLTDSVVSSSLITHRVPWEMQVEGLIGLAVGAGSGAGERTTALESCASRVITGHREALAGVRSMPSTPGARHRKAPFGKALLEAAHRHDGVLLRHVSEVRVSADIDPLLAKAPPRSRVVAKRLRPRAVPT